MSQKIGDVVNSQGKTIDQVKADSQKEFEQARREYNDLTNKSFQDSLRNTSGTEKIERRPSTSIGSQGYNPNLSTNPSSGNSLPKNDSLNKPGVPSDKVGDKESLNNNQEQPINKNETAPDIGKDYGDSMPSTPNVRDGNPIERGVPTDAQQQDVQKAANDIDNSLKKENELEDIDKKKEAEEQKKNDAQQQDSQNQTQNSDQTPVSKQAQVPNQAQAQQAVQNQGKKSSLPQQEKKENNQGENKGESQVGNGYGALRRNRKNQPQPTDATQNARRNMDHQNKVNSENNPKKPSLPRKGLGAGLGGGMMSSLSSRIKGGMKNFFNRANNDFSDGNNGSDSEHDNSFMGDLMKKLMSSITSNPFFLITVGVILLLLLILLATLDGGIGGRGKRVCTYELSGLSSSGTVEIKDAKVELINCDGSEKNGYEVLETIDFEKYILGVTLAEAGPGHQYDDTYKAQLIAVRNFTLTRHLGMCPSHPDDCFHGYNFQTNTFRMRACTNDQVYWDYTKDCPAQDRDGKPTLYCFGVENPNKIWKKALSEEEIARYEAIAEEVMGEVLLDENGDVLKLGYKAPQTEKFISLPAEGYDYKQILNEVYGSDTISDAKCTYTGHFDYGDYTLTSDGHTVLNQSLESFLSSHGSSLEKFNNLIENNVKGAGYGTRAGVVAAAVTLIGELGDNYGVKVPYYWGGGHYDGVVVGALGYWGSGECNTSANGRVYDKCGLDCSGFVPWAIKNGGFNMSQNLASRFQNLKGARRVSLNSNSAVVMPGDLLESDSHVVLVIGIDEEKKQYICAEAAGYDYGVLFVRRPFGSDGYWGVDMEEYYNNEANIRESD